MVSLFDRGRSRLLHAKRASLWLSLATSAIVASALAGLVAGPSIAEAAPPKPAARKPAASEVDRLSEEMTAHFRAGRYAEAAPLAERILALHDKKLGPSHATTVDAAADLAAIENMLGRYARAEALLIRAVKGLEAAHGPDHPDVLLRVLDLGTFYKERRDSARAEPLLARALEGCEKAFGPEHLRVADAAFALAQLHTTNHDFARAEPLYLRSLAIREKIAGPSSLATAKSVNDLANIYSDRGDFARAAPLHERAVTIAEKTLGPTHPELASFLHAQALTFKLAGDLAKAEPLYLRSLAIREKALGATSAALIAPLQNLASLYKARGDYVRAEPLYQRALAIAEKAHGPEGLVTATVLSSFGLYYRAMRDYARAEPLYLRSLAIREKVRGPEHVEVGDSVNNLGLLHAATGEHAKAEPLLRRALSIYEKGMGPEHPKVATALTNLATIARARGELDAAKSLLLRALAIAEKSSGKDHVLNARTLNNLAAVQLGEGDFTKAEETLRRALAIDEGAYGKDHPEIATVLDNLALVRMFQGDAKGALPLLARSSAMQDRHAALVLGSGSEEQKRVFMLALEAQTFEAVALQALSGDAEGPAMRLALETVLRRKGRVLDAMAGSIAALRQRLDEGDRRALDELSSVQAGLSRLLLRAEASTKPEQRAEIAALDAKREALEAQISRRSASFRAEAPLVTLEQVEAAIPSGAALIETFAFRPLGAEARSTGRFAPARYGAWIVRRGAPLRFVDLGEAARVDEEVTTLRRDLSDPSRDPKATSRALDARIMAKIRPLLGDARALYLSPDGALNLVPFGALLDESGRYLLERYEITYVSSGRDLLRRAELSSDGGPAVILANPDFGAKGASSGEARDRGALRGISFPPLPGTKAEGETIGKALGATVLEGAAASEEAMKQLHRPRILHLATHGFFLPVRRSVEPSLATRGLTLDEDAMAPGLAAESPLLRSGIALATINAPRASGEDGVLTALEASGLDLHGTRLVVLSACETALGEARDGEGVYGLRRALILAGAETQVMSLWKVDDGATRDLMVRYYEALRAGGGRSAALREVALGMLASKTRAHPFYWASFIVSGNDAPLEAASGAMPPKVEPGPRGCACSMPGGERTLPSPRETPVSLALLAVLAAARRATWQRASRPRR